VRDVDKAGKEHMTKEEAWLMWMNESKHYVEYDWDTIKKSSHWESFSRGWDAASINANGWDDAYKMGMEAGKELPQREWVGLTKEEAREISLANRPYVVDMVAALEQRLKEKNT
jgi:hypothetical protein